MRTMKLDPFWRTSVGFDRLFDLMDESLRYEPEDHYPPCNIVRTGEDKYRISLAVAGFKPEQISVTVYQNTLTIAGRVNERQGDAEYLYRGIAGRPLRRTYGERRNFGTPTSARGLPLHRRVEKASTNNVRGDKSMRIIAVAAAAGLLVAATTGSLAQYSQNKNSTTGRSGDTPGQQMQEKGSKPGHPGASGYAPGHETTGQGPGRSDKSPGHQMQEKGSKSGSPGASGYAPGRN